MTGPAYQPTGTEPIRDGHTLNLKLASAEIYLDVNCPHDGTDWTGYALMDRPRCRRAVDPWGTPDDRYANTCMIAEWSEAVTGAADLLDNGDNTFTVTALPIEVIYWWSAGDQLYLRPVEGPPSEAEYKARVAEVAARAATPQAVTACPSTVTGPPDWVAHCRLPAGHLGDHQHPAGSWTDKQADVPQAVTA